MVTATGQDPATNNTNTNITTTGPPPRAQEKDRPQEKDVYIIFIHALQSGLYRVQIVEYEKTQTK